MITVFVFIVLLFDAVIAFSEKKKFQTIPWYYVLPFSGYFMFFSRKIKEWQE